LRGFCHTNMQTPLSKSGSTEIIMPGLIESRASGCSNTVLNSFCKKIGTLYPSFFDDTQRITAAFGRTAFIHLTRLNKLDQAVSYVKAEQSGLWHMAADGSELERSSPAQQLRYDPDSIAERIVEVSVCDANRDSWFVSHSN